MRSLLIAGFTLVEVLVAVLVLAVGILGAAGAQVAALRTRHGTGLMSGGVQLASTLADQLRATTTSGDAASSGYFPLDYDADSDGEPLAPAVACFAGSTCSSAQMAAHDIYEIKHALFTGFPGGRIVVCRDAAAGVESQRTLAWECEDDGAAPLIIKLGWRGRQGASSPASATPFAPSLALVVGGGS